MLNVDENTRTVSGYGTVEIVDNQGDYVPIDVVLRLMDTYMNRGGVLVDTHTNRHVGKILHWEPKEKNGKNAVWLQAQIFDDYSIDDMIWDAIKEGHYTGFSFGGRGLDKHVVCNAEQGCFNHIDDMEIWEWSIVPKPANKESTIDEFNKLAKGDKLADAMMPVLNSKGNIEYMEVELLQKAEKESPEEEKAYLEEDVDLAEGEEADCPLKEKEKAMGNREMNPDSDRPLQYDRDTKHSERVKPDRRNRRKLSSTEIKDARNVAEASNDPKQNFGKDDIPEYMMSDGHDESSQATKRAIRYSDRMQEKEKAGNRMGYHGLKAPKNDGLREHGPHPDDPESGDLGMDAEHNHEETIKPPHKDRGRGVSPGVKRAARAGTIEHANPKAGEDSVENEGFDSKRAKKVAKRESKRAFDKYYPNEKPDKDYEKGEQNMTMDTVEILVPMEKSDGTVSWEPVVADYDYIQKAANPRMGYHGMDGAGRGKKETTESRFSGNDKVTRNENTVKPRNTRNKLSAGDEYGAESVPRSGYHDDRDTFVDDVSRGTRTDNKGTPARKDGKNYKSSSQSADKAMKREERVNERLNKETEKAGDEVPVTPPAEESDSPMNQILKKLEGIESRITKLEGTSGQPEIESGETEKAETPKKVTLPEAEQTNDTTHATDDHQIQQGKSKTMNKSEELASVVQNELQKAGYTETPRPAAQSDQPFMGNDGTTIQDVLMKSDEGGFDMHKALANKSFDDLNTLFGGK